MNLETLLRDAFKAGRQKGAHQSYYDAPLDEDEYVNSIKDEINEAIVFNENKKLREALNHVLSVIENNDNWWIDCPDRGGFDVDLIKNALK